MTLPAPLPWLSLLLLASAPSAQAPSGAAFPGRADAPAPAPLELAGKPLGPFPYFQHVRTFNAGEPIWIAFDPLTERTLAHRTLDVYLSVHEDLPRLLGGDKLRGQPVHVSVGAGAI